MFKKSVKPLCNTNELQQWDNRPFVTSLSQARIQFKDPIRSLKKKVKRLRTAFTTGQLKVLESSYNRCKYINAKFREELASLLKISEKTIKIWFQNRRMKERREMQEANQEEYQQGLDINYIQYQNYNEYTTLHLDPQSFDTNDKAEQNCNNGQYQNVHNYYNYAPVNLDVYPEYYAQCNPHGSSYCYSNTTQSHYQVNNNFEYNTQFMSYPSAPDYEDEFLDVIN